MAFSKRGDMIVAINGAFNQNRVAHLLEALHRQFPAFGTLKVIDFEEQSVLVQKGTLYHHVLHIYGFKIVNGRLVYRRKRRKI